MSPTIRAGDVSDMLEPKKAGPSVLRLTEPTNPAPQRAPRPQKEFQVAETKKQRQNRKKTEERKAATQDVEKEHQALLEKQRRAAREARGEPARNGLQQSQPPASNAWSSKPQTAEAAPQIQGAPAVQPLLDTFEAANVPTLENAQTSTVPRSSQNEFSNGMTEEEQFSLASKISHDSDGWATVALKKGKKQTEGPVPRPFPTIICPGCPEGAQWVRKPPRRGVGFTVPHTHARAWSQPYITAIYQQCSVYQTVRGRSCVFSLRRDRRETYQKDKASEPLHAR